MNTYECMLLLDNRDVRKGWQQLKDGVTGLMTKHGAKVLSAKRWAERRLAYPIRHNGSHHLRGTYLLAYLDSPAESVAALRRELQLSDLVMRHLLLQCDSVPPDAHEPEAEFDEAAVLVEEVARLDEPSLGSADDDRDDDVADDETSDDATSDDETSNETSDAPAETATKPEEN